MKQLYFNLLAVMLFAITSAGFSSCSSDDDDDKINVEYVDKSDSGNVGTTKTLVGTWRHNMSDGGYYVYVFNADGTGYYQEYDEGRLHTPDMYSWTYNPNTKVVMMIFGDEDDYAEKWIVKTLDTKTLIIINDDGYEEILTRQ